MSNLYVTWITDETAEHRIGVGDDGSVVYELRDSDHAFDVASALTDAYPTDVGWREDAAALVDAAQEIARQP